MKTKTQQRSSFGSEYAYKSAQKVNLNVPLTMATQTLLCNSDADDYGHMTKGIVVRWLQLRLWIFIV